MFCTLKHGNCLPRIRFWTSLIQLNRLWETWFIFWIYMEVKDSYFFVFKSMNNFFNLRKQTVYYERLMTRVTSTVCCHRDCVSYCIPFFEYLSLNICFSWKPSTFLRSKSRLYWWTPANGINSFGTFLPYFLKKRKEPV